MDDIEIARKYMEIFNSLDLAGAEEFISPADGAGVRQSRSMLPLH